MKAIISKLVKSYTSISVILRPPRCSISCPASPASLAIRSSRDYLTFISMTITTSTVVRPTISNPRPQPQAWTSIGPLVTSTMATLKSLRTMTTALFRSSETSAPLDLISPQALQARLAHLSCSVGGSGRNRRPSNSLQTSLIWATTMMKTMLACL